MCPHVSSQLGTSVGNHCFQWDTEPGLDTWGSGGREGPGGEPFCPGWGSWVSWAKGSSTTHPLAVPEYKSGYFTSLQVMSKSPLIQYRVTVPTHCFHQLEKA